jgi:hypothetical protein
MSSGATASLPNWLSPRRVIYDHQLYCSGSGSRFELAFPDGVRQLPPESYIVIPPGRWHERRACSRGGAERLKRCREADTWPTLYEDLRVLDYL